MIPLWLWDYIVATMLNFGPQRRDLGMVTAVNYETMG